MSIKKDEITTDITLELDEEVISISDFQKATVNFLGLVKEVSKQVSDNKSGNSDWSVKVYSGSAGLGVSGRSSNIHSDKTREAIVSGIRSLS